MFPFSGSKMMLKPKSEAIIPNPGNPKIKFSFPGLTIYLLTTNTVHYLLVHSTFHIHFAVVFM